jgi:hypothetical protein
MELGFNYQRCPTKQELMLCQEEIQKLDAVAGLPP